MLIDAILPVHPLHGDCRDVLRALILTGSMKKTGFIEHIQKILVIVPDHTVTAASVLKDACPIAEIIPESRLFSRHEQEAMEYVGGWHRQQIIKLAANRVSRSHALLMLDSDVINLRSVPREELIQGGRIIAQTGLQFDKWKIDSAAVIDVSPVVNTMGVTPAMLHVGIITAMQGIVGGYSERWIEKLCRISLTKAQWTEYMLYQAAAEKLGLWDGLHFFSEIKLSRGIWKNTTVNDKFFKDLSADNPLFLVSQSLRDDFGEVQQKLYDNNVFSMLDLPSELRERVTPNAMKALAPLDEKADIVGPTVTKMIEDRLSGTLRGSLEFISDLLKAPDFSSNEGSDPFYNLIRNKNFSSAANKLRKQAYKKHAEVSVQILYCELLEAANRFFDLYQFIMRRLQAKLLPFRVFQAGIQVLISKQQTEFVVRCFRIGQAQYRDRSAFFRLKGYFYTRIMRFNLAKIAATRSMELDARKTKA